MTRGCQLQPQKTTQAEGHMSMLSTNKSVSAYRELVEFLSAPCQLPPPFKVATGLLKLLNKRQ